MPLVQPGQTNGLSTAPKLYGVGKQENTILFREKLMRLFKPQDYITVENITDIPCYWQYVKEEDETIGFSENGMQKQVTRSEPKMWMIPPKKSEVIEGFSAYLGLDVMYKNWAASKTLNQYKDPNSQVYDEAGQHTPRNFNFSDSGAMDEFLELAYKGKATPASFQTYYNGEQQTAHDLLAPENQDDGTPDPGTVTPPPGTEQNPLPPAPDGAPLVEPTYAEPDAEPDVTETATNAAKRVVAGAKK